MDTNSNGHWVMTSGARRGFMILCTVLAISLGIFGYLVYDQGQRLHDTQVSLCKQQSAARVRGNNQFRRPLKAALKSIENILRKSAKRGRPKYRKELHREAARFHRLRNQVVIVGPFKCKFDG